MFDSIKIRRPKLNRFDLSHDVKLSGKMGVLIPTLCEEIVPGDRWRVNSEIMLRFAPMLAPIMHRVHVYTHYFFVPNRIIWDEWEDFITGGADGTAAPVWPHYNLKSLQSFGVTGLGSLWDYFGGKTLGPSESLTDDFWVSALPARGYSEIFNEYYRDQTLVSEVAYNKTSGLQTDYDIWATRVRAWEKDYFTSALPWTQRGSEVSIPVQLKSPAEFTTTAGSKLTTPDTLGQVVDLGSTTALRSTTNLEQVVIDAVEGVDVNDLRRSNALQRWLELAARGGSRYAEQLLSFFGVKSSDARLQRPEYLGGGRQNVMISEVLQTGETGTTPQGNMSGHGVSVGASNKFQKRFEEHGYVFGIMSVLPRTSYQDGIPRHFTREDKFDYYFPQFAHLGEQGIKKYEVYFNRTTGLEQNSGTWGYQSRYAEYKHRSGRVAGDFRDSLDYWHLGRKFSSYPGLNSSFVSANEINRIFADTSGTDTLWCQIYHNISALRPMPYYADPSL